MSLGNQGAGRRKPTTAQLGVNLETLPWQRSGAGDGSFEVAFVAGPGLAGVPGRDQAGPDGADDLPVIEWVLMRVAGDPARRVLVYDREEWRCFLDGARNGEFDPESQSQSQSQPRPADRHFSDLYAEKGSRSLTADLRVRSCQIVIVSSVTIDNMNCESQVKCLKVGISELEEAGSER
jgi:hypothetical protein